MAPSEEKCDRLLELPYYADKVRVCNPAGHIGILTLWSRVDMVLERYLKDLPPSVAAVSNFYGDGISQLLANLLWNPQITVLLISGSNRTGSLEELLAFFNEGVEAIELNGTKQARIIGTNRLINQALAAGPILFGSAIPTRHWFDNFELLAECLHTGFWECLKRGPQERVAVKLVEPKISTFPSVVAGHQVIAEKPLDAWVEALFLIERFGLPVQLAKGQRKELLNLKVVVTEPQWHTEGEYHEYSTDLGHLQRYAAGMLDPVLPDDQPYSYGHRLGRFFGFDAVQEAIRRLRADQDDRKCLLSLWDTQKDLVSESGHPCLVTVFFRVTQKALALTATFRTHRAYTAWIDNFHGLLELQSRVANALGMGRGPLTVFSQSISIDPSMADQVSGLTKGRKWRMRDDHRGNLTFGLEGGQIVVEHTDGGLVLKRYTGHSAEVLAHQLAQDYVVGDLSHALYVGRQLGKLQVCLKHGLQYEES